MELWGKFYFGQATNYDGVQNSYLELRSVSGKKKVNDQMNELIFLVNVPNTCIYVICI